VGKRCNNKIPPCRVEFSIPGVEIIGQGPGIKLIAFPVCGLENKFLQGGQCRSAEWNNNLHNVSTLSTGK
jgi:hypothetical protein